MVTTDQIVDVLGGIQNLRHPAASLDDLRDEIREGLPYASVENLVTRFGIARERLAEALDIPVRTLARRKRERWLHADESDRLFRVARVLAQATSVLGSEAKASRWLNRPNRALGGETPLGLLDTDIGTREVEAVLGRLEHGVFS